MKAVIRTGSKQYKVQEGESIRVEKLSGNPGDTITFEEVLLVFNDKEVAVGQPLVEKAAVTGTFVKEDKEDKIVVFKMKRRKGYRLKKGHRQKVSVVKIDTISLGSGKKVEKKEAAEAPVAEEKKEAKDGS